MRSLPTKVLLLLFLASLLVVVPADQPIAAQGASCEAIIEQIDAALTTCEYLNENWVCYGNPEANAQPPEVRFHFPGDRAWLASVGGLNTGPAAGAVLMHLKPLGEPNPVEAILVGDAALSTTDGLDSVFFLRTTREELVCELTPPALVVHTDEGTQGRVTVNGVVVELSSAAAIPMEDPDTMVVVNMRGNVTLGTPTERVEIPLGYQGTLTGIAAGQPVFDGPPTPSPYFDSALYQFLAGLQGLRRIGDGRVEPPRPTETPDGTSTPTPTPVCGGEVVYGQTIREQNIDPGQECLYTFCAEAGDRVSISLTSEDSGLDPYVDLYAPDGGLLRANDDITVSELDSLICEQGLPYSACGYVIVARNYRNQSTGPFSLSLNKDETCPTPPPPCACTVVTRSGLRLRAGPGLDSAITAVLPMGTKVEVLDCGNDAWEEVRVVSSGQVGWVSTDPNLLYCEKPPPTPTPSVTTTVTVIETVTVGPTPTKTPTKTPRPTKEGPFGAP